MSGASDKARFYLEKSVPELQECERKGIFNKREISQIASKRSDFEHVLNGRGSKPLDYARYAEYEMNLERLRQKRAKRMGVKVTNHLGQRRIFFILDRATRKFPGDMGLWMQAIEFARGEHANKKLSQLFSSVLRLHPTRAELWIYTAKNAIDDQGDMTVARGFMQRGLRFCKSTKTLWLEYAKLEMSYIWKIASRRKILGISDENAASTIETKQEAAVSREDVDPDSAQDAPADQGALKNLDSTPVLTGAIPMAIFDAAMNQFNNESKLSRKFFDMFAKFRGVACLAPILQHVVEVQLKTAPKSAVTLLCHARQPVDSLELRSPFLPQALGTTLERLKSSYARTDNQAEFASHAFVWLNSLLQDEELDRAIRRVILASLKQTRELAMKAQPDDAQIRRMLDAAHPAGGPQEQQKTIAARQDSMETS